MSLIASAAIAASRGLQCVSCRCARQSPRHLSDAAPKQQQQHAAEKRPAAAATDAEDEEQELLGHEGEQEGGVIGRKQVVRPTLWETYSSKVRARMENPLHRGTITQQDAESRGCDLVVVDHGSEACGDALRLFWAVQKGTGIIVDARFQTFGCATAIAASDATAELCIGKTVDDARKLVTSSAVEKFLRDDPDKPAVPPQKMHCSVMASEVVKKAAESSGVATDEGPKTEDDTIVCDCAQVTLGAVRRAIREHGLRTVAEVTQTTKAGAFCGACKKPGGHEKKDRYLLDIIKAERVRARVVKAIEDAVAPSLGAHAGSAEVLDVTFVDDDDDDEGEATQPDAADGGPMKVPAKCDKKSCKKKKTVVRLAFKGACSSCPHSGSATLMFVEDALRREMNDPTLVVIPSS